MMRILGRTRIAVGLWLTAVPLAVIGFVFGPSHQEPRAEESPSPNQWQARNKGITAAKVRVHTKAPEGVRLLTVGAPWGSPLFGQVPSIAARELPQRPQERVWRIFVRPINARDDYFNREWTLSVDPTQYAAPWDETNGGKVGRWTGTEPEVVELPIPPAGRYDIRLLCGWTPTGQLLSVESDGSSKSFEIGEFASGEIVIKPKNYRPNESDAGGYGPRSVLAYETMVFDQTGIAPMAVRPPAGSLPYGTGRAITTWTELPDGKGYRPNSAHAGVLAGIPLELTIFSQGIAPQTIKVPALTPGESRVIEPSLTTYRRVRARVMAGKTAVKGALVSYHADSQKFPQLGTPYYRPGLSGTVYGWGEKKTDDSGYADLEDGPATPSPTMRVTYTGGLDGLPVCIDYVHPEKEFKIRGGRLDFGTIDVSGRLAHVTLRYETADGTGFPRELKIATRSAQEDWRIIEIDPYEWRRLNLLKDGKVIDFRLFGLEDGPISVWSDSRVWSSSGGSRTEMTKVSVINDRTDRKGVRYIELALRDSTPEESAAVLPHLRLNMVWTPVDGMWLTGGLLPVAAGPEPVTLMPLPGVSAQGWRNYMFSQTDPVHSFGVRHADRAGRRNSFGSQDGLELRIPAGKWRLWLSDGESFGERIIEVRGGLNLIDVSPTMMREDCPVLRLTTEARGKPVAWVWVEWFPTESLAEAVVKDGTRAPGWGITCTGTNGETEVIGMPPNRPFWVRLTDAKGVASVFKVDGLAGGVVHSLTVGLP